MKKILTIKELCLLLNKSRTTIWRWVNSGILPKPIKLGPNSVGFLVSDLNEWLQSRPLAEGGNQ